MDPKLKSIEANLHVGHGAWYEDRASSYKGHLKSPHPSLGLKLAVFCDPMPCHSIPIPIRPSDEGTRMEGCRAFS